MKPAHGFGAILLHSAVLLVHVTKAKLSAVESLIGRHPVPAHGLFGVVFLHAVTCIVHGTVITLRVGISLTGAHAVQIWNVENADFSAKI